MVCKKTGGWFRKKLAGPRVETCRNDRVIPRHWHVTRGTEPSRFACQIPHHCFTLLHVVTTNSRKMAPKQIDMIFPTVLTGPCSIDLETQRQATAKWPLWRGFQGGNSWILTSKSQKRPETHVSEQYFPVVAGSSWIFLCLTPFFMVESLSACGWKVNWHDSRAATL